MAAPKWFTQAVIDEKVAFDRSLIEGHIHIYGCIINRPDGRLFAKLGDYIIREAGGRIYSCKPEVFRKAYEKAYEKAG